MGKDEQQIKVLMDKLQISEEEARQVIADDKAIDKGEKLFSLTEEQEKASKKARGTGTKAPTIYKFDKKEKKTNSEKLELMKAFEEIAETVGAVNLEILNPEREFTFSFNDKKYKIVLSMPRG